jgi:hypothetical protein
MHGPDTAFLQGFSLLAMKQKQLMSPLNYNQTSNRGVFFKLSILLRSLLEQFWKVLEMKESEQTDYEVTVTGVPALGYAHI